MTISPLKSPEINLLDFLEAYYARTHSGAGRGIEFELLRLKVLKIVWKFSACKKSEAILPTWKAKY